MAPAPNPIVQIIRVNTIEGLKSSCIGFMLWSIDIAYQLFN